MKRPLLLFLGLAACHPPAPPDPPEPNRSIEIGLSQEGDFVAVADGQELELVAGAQGGYHLDLAARVEGMPERIDVEREARRLLDGELVARSRFRSNVEGEGRLSFENPVFLCPAPVGISVADETLEVTYRVGEVEARTAFVPRCPAGDTFCDQICRR